MKEKNTKITIEMVKKLRRYSGALTDAMVRRYLSTEAEKKIDSRYFNIILMDDRDITIQSRNKGHYYTDESSKAIYRQTPVETIKRNYLMFHTMAPEVAIEDLKEIYKQKDK